MHFATPSSLHAVCEGTAVRLSPAQVSQHLAKLPGWGVRDQRLHKAFDFRSFVEAIDFVNRVAVEAERRNHHPLLSIDKRRVEITLWTRKLACLTTNDFQLAAATERLAEAQR